MLPDFVVLGASKAGTTTLYHWLNRHPEVYVPRVKDTFFFNQAVFQPPWPPVRTQDEYEALFAGVDAEKVVGEVTASYFTDITSAAAIHALIPDAMLIVSLREPVSRIYSMAQMVVRDGRAADIATEALRLADDPSFFMAPYVRSIFEHFDRDHLLALRHDSIVGQPTATSALLFGFLGVDTTFRVDAAVHNPGGVPRSAFVHRITEWPPARRLRGMFPPQGYDLLDRLRQANRRPAPPLPDRVERRLHDRYRDDVLETQDLLGVDLSAWLQN